MGVILIKRVKPPKLASKQSLLSGCPMSRIQPLNIKHRVNGVVNNWHTENTTGKGQGVPDPDGDVCAQQCGPEHSSTVLYVSLIRIKRQKILRLVILSFEMFQTRNTLLWWGTLMQHFQFLWYITQCFLDVIKIILFPQNIFQSFSLKLQADVQIFFPSRMWQLWRSRVYSVFCWSP